MAIVFKEASAIVTGGASGIGQSIARALAARGARVVVADINGPAAEVEAAALRAQGHDAFAETVDVTDATAVERMVANTEARWGRIDFYFNNAGIAYIGELLDMGNDAWQRTIDVNLWGVAHGIRSVYPRMVKQGSGCIVNTASVAGLAPSPGFTIYAATKHAVVGLSRSLRVEAKQYGVQVNVLCPGFIRTPLISNAKYSGMDGVVAANDIQKKAPFAEPDLVATDLMKGIERNKAVIVTPASARVAMLILRLAPFTSDLFAGKLMQVLRGYRVKG